MVFSYSPSRPHILMEKLSLFVNHESFLLRHIPVIIGVTMSSG